jgi:hypothetical protein
MCRCGAWWMSRVGLRGTFLLLVAGFDLVYGWTRMIHPDPTFRAGRQYQLLSQIFPLDSTEASMTVWGMLWWFVAVIAGVSAFKKNDRWGFGAAIGIKVSWLFGNVYAWANGLDGGGGLVAVWVFVLAATILFSCISEASPAMDKLADDVHDTGEFRMGGPHDPE